MKSIHRVLFLGLVMMVFPVVQGCDDDTNASGDGGEAPWGNGGGGSGVGGGSTSSGGSTGNVEPADMAGMTEAHNKARAKVSPAPASPMPALTWSSDLAAIAKTYSENCVWEHSMGDLGENLYANAGFTETPQGVVDSWVSETADYDYAANTCNAGAQCGHYTQVVWADTLRVGCGMTTCTVNSPFGGGDWDFWVCNYDPPGNWVGEKPY